MEETRKPYAVIVGRSPQDLEDKVLRMIKEGYAPWGGFGIDGGRLVQPMIWRKGLDG